MMMGDIEREKDNKKNMSKKTDDNIREIVEWEKGDRKTSTAVGERQEGNAAWKYDLGRLRVIACSIKYSCDRFAELYFHSISSLSSLTIQYFHEPFHVFFSFL